MEPMLHTQTPSRSQEVATRLRRGWELRRSHDLEGALIELLSLKGMLGLNAGAFSASDAAFRRVLETNEFGTAGPGIAESLAALTASMERASGRVGSSERILDETLEVLARIAHTPGTLLRFERALNAFATGDYTRALDDFVRVQNEASQGNVAGLRPMALINSILCLENLGLPFNRLRAELQVELAASPEAPATVRTQLQALEFREAFRQGRVECLEQPGHLGQSIYLAAWASQLPYLKLSDSARASRQAEFMEHQAGSFNRSFRARTLQGMLASEDLRPAKPSEIVDRFYLWVWRYVVTGDASLLAKSLSMLASSRVFEQLDRLTREDYALLENALLWLALFDIAPADRAAEISRLMPRHGLEAFPTLELERLLLDWLHARRSRQNHLIADFQLRFESHPLRLNPKFDFQNVLSHMRVASLLNDAPIGKKRPDHSLTVDLRRGLIVSNGRQTVSRSIAPALWLISRESGPSMERLTEVAFGLRRYDPTIHAPKIANMLSRARRMLPTGLGIRTLDGHALSEGDWSQIHFIGGDSIEIELARNEDWQAVFGGGASKVRRISARTQRKEPGPGSALSTSAHAIPSEMSRSELERLVARPRSTVNRLIARWEKKGFLTRRGNSRSTRYRLSAEFRRLIVTQGVPI
jgi:hypothetical protein